MAAITIDLKQNGKTSSLLQAGDYQLIIDRPVEKGGTAQGPMGGQALLMGVGGCFASTLYAAALARNLEIKDLGIRVIATVSETAPKRFEAIELEVISGTCGNEEEFEKLLHIAEKGCIAVNTIKNGVRFRTYQPTEEV